MSQLCRVIALCAVLLALPRSAAADTITIGLFAPTAPFESSGDRVSFINAVADHLAAATKGDRVIGRVYSTAGAFAAAIKKGEIEFAIIDAPYAAANGLPYNILASAVRQGGANAPWQLIAKSSIGSVRDLRGAKVAIPAIGARVAPFVTNALLGGEVDAGYFARISEAADARSAITMIAIGKVDAAFVPAGIDAPAGTKRIATLSNVGWPMFVALPAASGKDVRAFAAQIKSFSGSGTFTGFTDAGAGSYHALQKMFGKSSKRGPMTTPPPARLGVRDLLAGRTFDLQLSNVLDLVQAPPSQTAAK